jgi:hypothetical protein
MCPQVRIWNYNKSRIHAARGTHFTRFTSTKVQILTQKLAERARASSNCTWTTRAYYADV